jgi:farnesyl-diphosphate farnesyltransferase
MAARRQGESADGSVAAAEADRAFCYAVLPRVSRTFALGIRLLPPRLEHSVLLAYLLCRVADTIEDSPGLPAAGKADLLAHFSRCLGPDGPAAGPLTDAFAQPRTDEERLAQAADVVLREYRRLPPAEREAIRPWVQEMCAGMAEFARRGADGSSGLAALASLDELDRYCYYVAGTVGHLLTGLFRAHDRRPAADRYLVLERLATSFGLGLQLTNIIKDVADDRRRGWSFVPQQLYQLAGIRPDEFQDGGHDRESREVMRILIEKARRHLRDALEYCTRLPRVQYRVRLFCLTSLYFAVRTLKLAEHDPRLLDPGHKVKITRGQVYRTVVMTHLFAPSNALVRAYFGALGG